MSRVYDVVSPHLDDAALSCALFLAAHPGCRVITAFAGGPAAGHPLTPWDRAAKYFPDGADVTGVRRGEDISAVAMVNATAHHLPYWDGQYRTERHGYPGPAVADLPAAIAADLTACAGEQPGRPWVVPLGLGHPDHRITAEACLIFAERYPGDVYVYEELPYSAEDPPEVAGRKADLARRGLDLVADEALAFAPDLALKRAAIRCHVSQRGALRRRARTALRAPERIWRLVPAGGGAT